MNNSSRINTIQLLRAIAVILVVHCHAIDYQEYVKSSFQQHFFYLENFGAVGVDIFFVISGFIITVISRRYAIENKGFYFFVKRFIRVMPVYWIVSFASIFLLYLHHSKKFNTALIPRAIILFPFFKTSLNVNLALFQAWTLYFEMAFYIITSIAIIVYSKKYMAVTVLFFLFMICLNYLTVSHKTIMIILGNGIMIEFLMGVIIGLVFSSAFVISNLAANIIFMTGIAGLAATIFFGYGDISEAPQILNGTASMHRSLLWGGFSFLLVGGLVMKEKITPIGVHSFWIAIGNASFSIYLTHVLFLAAIYVRWRKWNLQNYTPADLQIFISMAIAILGGYIVYRVIEVPVLRKLGSLADGQFAKHKTSKIPQ